MRSLLHHEPELVQDLNYDSTLERSSLTSASVALVRRGVHEGNCEIAVELDN